MIHVYDRQRRLTGILENAHSVMEEKRLNAISHISFSLPYGDSKTALCQPRHYIRYTPTGDLYRILPTENHVNELGHIRYRCEHVLSLLIDNVMFGNHERGGIGDFTANVLRWILSRQNMRWDLNTGWTVDPQKTIDWVLGDCEFARQFEYNFEQETILRAIFAVPNRFTETYKWEFNTNVYPFVLHLRRVNKEALPTLYIRERRNLLNLVHTSDTTDVVTRLYPLGQGEGVLNQVNIRSVNNGVPFIQSPQGIIDKYGIIERVWIDRRYYHAEHLLEAAQAMLEQLQEPFEKFEVDFATLGAGQWDRAELGEIAEIVDFERNYIVGIDYWFEDIKKSKLYIANRSRDVAGTVADMMDRQRIEMSHAQGSTTIFERDVQGNADTNNSMALRMNLPTSLHVINSVIMDVDITPFRMPFAVTSGGGGTTATSGGGGGTTFSSAAGGSGTPTSSSGGSSSPTSQGGGATTQTSTNSPARTTHAPGQVQRGDARTIRSGGDPHPWHWHETEVTTFHTHNIPAHNHSTTIPSHTHVVNVPAHTHTVSIGTHTHSITIANHTHSVTINPHVHDLTPNIQLRGNPTGFFVWINGQQRLFHNGRQLTVNITQFLVDASGNIPRQFHRVAIVPNDFAYVMLTCQVAGFTRTATGGVY